MQYKKYNINSILLQAQKIAQFMLLLRGSSLQLFLSFSSSSQRSSSWWNERKRPLLRSQCSPWVPGPMVGTPPLYQVKPSSPVFPDRCHHSCLHFPKSCLGILVNSVRPTTSNRRRFGFQAVQIQRQNLIPLNLMTKTGFQLSKFD